MLLRFFTITLLMYGCLMKGQSAYNNALKYRIENRTLGDEFTIAVKGNTERLKQHAAEYGYKFNYGYGDVASITANLTSLSKLIEQKIVKYAEFIEPNKKVMGDTVRFRNRFEWIKTGQPPLPQVYDGTGVVFGIIDTGTDWRHQDFRTPTGATRIKWIWEQSGVGGPAPQPYNYGKEWTEAQINASLCTHDDVVGNSHGTHVSGVAVGNGLATGNFEGCAPKADIVVVALNFNLPGPTIADGVNYIFSKATQLGKPCVINASVGDYYGSHDGTDLEAKLIEGMLTNVPGRVMVAAGGNAGEARYHTLTQPPVGDTVFTWYTNGTSTLRYYAYGDTNQVKNLQFNIGCDRPSNFSNVGSTGFKNYNYGIPSMQADTIKLNGNRIGIVKTSASINAYGVYELSVLIQADTLNLLWRTETKGVGLTHSWNFEFASLGLPPVGQYPRIVKYVKPDTLFSIVSGFQCCDEITTVANYCNLNRYYDYNLNLQLAFDRPGGSKVGNSSIGPTRDMRRKPDIAATGSGVFAAAAVNLQPSWNNLYPTGMAPGGQHVYGSGTSAASPVVAGFAALFLQSNPNLTSRQVRNAVMNCAYSDAYTGSVPNNAWGSGKLDAFASLFCVITGKEELSLIKEGNVFPNPFTDHVNLKFNRNVNGTVSVYSVDGKLLLEEKMNSTEFEIQEKGALKNYYGFLFVRVTDQSGSTVFKLIKNP